VSLEFSVFKTLATPKSVKWTYPLSSSTRFSGFKSLWIILCKCRCSRLSRMQAIKNPALFLFHQQLINYKVLLVVFSENRLFRPIWYLKSPPFIKSITKNRFSLSWKAKVMLIMKGCRIEANNSLSFITEWTLLLEITLILNF